MGATRVVTHAMRRVAERWRPAGLDCAPGEICPTGLEHSSAALGLSRYTSQAVMFLRVAVIRVLAGFQCIKARAVGSAKLELCVFTAIRPWRNSATGIALLVGGITQLWC